MGKHERFEITTIEVPISGTNLKILVEDHFWRSLKQRGVTVVFMHAGRPHVSDPVDNNRKHSVARVVMSCSAGFTARSRNPSEPLNLTPANLEVVSDGRAKYPALISIKPVEREDLIDPDWIDPGVGYGEDWEVYEDIEEALPSAPIEPVEVDQKIDEADLVIVIKDGHGLEGGLRSSRRVSPEQCKLGDTDIDPTKLQLQRLLNERARLTGIYLPSKGKRFKRFSKSFFNGGKVHKS